MYSPVLVVDEHDRPIGQAPLLEVRAKGWHHRIVRVIVESSDGKVLLQKRSQNVWMPGLWDQSVGGHVDAGEGYEQAAVREMAEEIGVHDVDLEELGSWQSQNQSEDGGVINRFNRVYRVTLAANQPVKGNPEEVAELKWFTIMELKELVMKQPDQVTDGLQKIATEYY